MSTFRPFHIADLHFAPGPNLAQVDRCMGFAIERAIAEGAHALVVAGDASDHALDVHSPAFGSLARHIRRAADHMPVLMLQGTWSHEPPGTLDVFRLLGGAYSVCVADRICQVALLDGGQWLESPDWAFADVPCGTTALFTCVPTVNKAVIGAVVGAADAAEAVGEQIAYLLRGFAPINQRARAAGVPTIGVSHGTVSGCTSEHGVPMAGFDHEYTAPALFAAGCSAFMLGHIHMHQSWEEAGRWIAYAGSLARLHYGEQGDKVCLQWEVTADGACYQPIATPAKRTIEIAFDDLPDMDVLRARAAQADIDGAFVRIRWSVPEDARHQVDREAIATLFGGAAETKLEGRVIPLVRTRAAGISLAPTMADKIKVWAEVTDSDAAPLLHCLGALQLGSPEAIVQRILKTPVADFPAPIVLAAQAGAPAQDAEVDTPVDDLFAAPAAAAAAAALLF